MKKIATILTILGMAFTAFFFFDNRYALSESMEVLEQRLDYKIVSDQQMTVMERVWKLEDRYEDREMPDSVKEEIRTLEEKRIDLGRKIDKLLEVQ